MDDRARQHAREALQSGSPDAFVKVLADRIRSGVVPYEHVVLAAKLGDPVAGVITNQKALTNKKRFGPTVEKAAQALSSRESQKLKKWLQEFVRFKLTPSNTVYEGGDSHWTIDGGPIVLEFASSGRNPGVGAKRVRQIWERYLKYGTPDTLRVITSGEGIGYSVADRYVRFQRRQELLKRLIESLLWA